MKKLGRSFKASLPRRLNGFAHPISNALAEVFNSMIQAIKSAALGFRNFAHDRVRILFHLGKLDLSLP
ncbi:MAG: transposase [Verrucomicrobiales bacterium]|nr:transposase [Verrucomicrobiales bacterium]